MQRSTNDLAKFHAPKKFFTYKIWQQKQESSSRIDADAKISSESSFLLPSWQQQQDASSSGTVSQVSSEGSSIDSSPKSLSSSLNSGKRLYEDSPIEVSKPEVHGIGAKGKKLSNIFINLDELDEDDLVSDTAFSKYPRSGGHGVKKISFEGPIREEGDAGYPRDYARGSGKEGSRKLMCGSKWNEDHHGKRLSVYEDEESLSGKNICEKQGRGKRMSDILTANQESYFYDQGPERDSQGLLEVESSFQIYQTRSGEIPRVESTSTNTSAPDSCSVSPFVPLDLQWKSPDLDQAGLNGRLLTSKHSDQTGDYVSACANVVVARGKHRMKDDQLVYVPANEYTRNRHQDDSPTASGKSVLLPSSYGDTLHLNSVTKAAFLPHTVTNSPCNDDVRVMKPQTSQAPLMPREGAFHTVSQLPSCSEATTDAFSRTNTNEDVTSNMCPDDHGIQQDLKFAMVSSSQCRASQSLNSESKPSASSCQRSYDAPDSAIPNSSKSEDHQVCQVCGDIAAGFHCGAYVCEACKKFFVRCLKQDVGEKFVCSRGKGCIINKETRTQCQYCRYHKCLSLGMYKPGSGPGGSKLSAEISHIPCKVCKAPSSGYHFGAITCEGCKGFFRRTVKERDGVQYTCSRSGNCAITTVTRNICKYCRYQKCLQAGMTPLGSRIGRQPNAVKHATMLELQRIQTGGPNLELSMTNIKKERMSPTHTDQANLLPHNAHLELVSSEEINLPEDIQRAHPGVLCPQESEAHWTQTNEETGTKGPLEIYPRYESEDPFERPSFQPENRLTRHVDKPNISGEENDLVIEEPSLPKGTATKPAEKTDIYDFDRQNLDRNLDHHQILDRQQSIPHQQSFGHQQSGQYGINFESQHSFQHRETLEPVEPISSHVRTDARQAEEQQLLLASQQLGLQPEVLQQARPSLLLGQQQLLLHFPAPFSQQHEQQQQLEPQLPPPGFSQQQPRHQYLTQPQPQRDLLLETKDLHQLTSFPQSPPLVNTAEIGIGYGPNPGLKYVDGAMWSESSAGNTSPVKPSTLDHLTQIQVTTPKEMAEASDQTAAKAGDTVQGGTSNDPSGQSSTTVEISSEDAAQISCLAPSTAEGQEKLDEIVKKVTGAYKLLQPICQRNPDIQFLIEGMSVVDIWGVMMGQFGQCARSTIKFARRVPGFHALPIESQIMQVQMSMYPIVLIVLSTMYDVENQVINYFNLKPSEIEILMRKFPAFQKLPTHFHNVGHTTKYFDLDDTELALLCALTLVASGAMEMGQNEETFSAQNSLLSDLVGTLMYYCAGKEGVDTNRGGYIMARLPELARCNLQHQQAVFQVQMDHPELEIPQLYRETYLNN